MLSKIFLEIQKQAQSFVSSNDGPSFEDKIIRLVQGDFQYTRLLNDKASKASGEKTMATQINKYLKKDIKSVDLETKNLKEEILRKNSLELIKNPWSVINRHFIHQPMDSQDYPDFIFFTKNYVIPIEVKYSKSKTSDKNVKLETKRPMWNSNLPKGNGIYIYGVAGKNVTFFKGGDILDSNTRIQLNKFFDDLGSEDDDGIDLKARMTECLLNLENPFGFKPYVRRAFEQSVSFSTVYDKAGRQYIESYFSEKSKIREKNVIDFFEEIEK